MVRSPLLGLAVLAGFVSTAAAQVPTLTRVSPLAIPPNKLSKISLLGTGIEKSPELWTSFPLVSPASAPDPDRKPENGKAYFQLQPTSDVIPGIYGIRVVTPTGATNLKLMMIDDLPTVNEVAAANKSVDKAQKLTLPIAVEGTYEAETFDYFTFHADAKQRISVEVVARRLSSPLDAVIRLLDSAGRELAYSDDDEAIGADPRFTHTFAKAGDYVIELRDIRYQGNTNSAYRLRIGDFPLLTAPYPAGVAQGSEGTIEPTGLNLGKLAPVKLKVGKNDAIAMRPLALHYADGQGSGFTAAIVGSGTEQVEAEPNDEIKKASKLVTSGAMNGRLDKPRDVDFYTFEGKKGAKVRFIGLTRAIGSPSDLYLRLLDKAGKQLADTDDAGLEEGTLEATLPADGAYVLAVEDLVGRGGPQFTYRIEIETDRPRLTAAAELDKYDVPRAGIAQIKVSVTRGGFDAPVNIKVVDAPGVMAVGSVAAGKPDGIVTLVFPPNFEAGKLLNLKLIAESTADKTPIACEVSTSAALRKSLGGINTPPSSLEGLVAIGFAPPAVEQFELTTKTPEVVWEAGKTKIEFVVDVERKKGFADGLTLTVYGLPEGFKAAAVTIDKAKKEGTVVVEGPAAPKDFRQPLQIVGTAVVAKKTVQASLTDVALATAKAAKPAPKKEVAKVEPAKPEAKAVAKAETKADAKPAAKPETKAVAKTETKPGPKTDAPAKPQADKPAVKTETKPATAPRKPTKVEP